MSDDSGNLRDINGNFDPGISRDDADQKMKERWGYGIVIVQNGYKREYRDPITNELRGIFE